MFSKEIKVLVNASTSRLSLHCLNCISDVERLVCAGCWICFDLFWGVFFYISFFFGAGSL